MYLSMALRVLLADESSTIKKAIQMALSDLGVDVKSVSSGLDVLAVSCIYKPDLIFADILLTKKNGYEVCAEIKNDPELKRTPVILMWSSFMQLDQTNFIKVKAEASLEKPFDSEALRSLVERYSPKTAMFPLKGLLNHPELPEFEESDTFVRQRTDYLNTQTIDKAKSSQPIEEIDSLDEIDDFAEMPLVRPKQNQVDDWAKGSPSSTDQYVVETESYGDFEEVTVMTSNPQTHSTPNLQQKIQEQLNTYIQDSPLAKSKAPPAFQRQMTSLDEQVMKEEIRMMAEKICWQILPEITEKIVREELSKLMNGLEKT
jgi:two-component system, cell cycle response regulator